MKSVEPRNEEELRKVVSTMRPAWAQPHYDAIRDRIGNKIAKRRRRHAIFATVAGITLLVGIGTGLKKSVSNRNAKSAPVLAEPTVFLKASRPAAAQAPKPSSAHEDSRVQVVSLLPQTDVKRGPQQDLLAFNLTKGAARFKVLPILHSEAQARPMEVHVRDLRIRDIGTVFDVGLLSDDSVKVSVQEGLVVVTGPGISQYVRAGQSAIFHKKQQVSSTTNKPKVSMSPSLSEEGKAPPNLAEPSVEVPEVRRLLAAADEARKEGRMGDALETIRVFVARCSHATSCSFGRFTEGKILQSMGRMEEAAIAFKRATQGPFAEEALVRAIEAFAQAGLAHEAERLKAGYLTTYPDGTFSGRLGLK